jgi:HSP20 family protein
MSGTSLQPQSGYHPMARRQDDGDPFMPFRRQMNRLFDDFFTGPMWPRFPMAVPTPVLEVVVTPQIEVSETDKEMQVTAELPGIDPGKVEVSLADDVLTIRGEKQQQQKQGPEQGQEQGRDYHLTERSYGRFARYLRLPFHADPGNIRASFKDGVLTVVIPKPEEMQQKVHRIPVATDGSQQTAGAPAQQAAAAE